MRQPQDFQGDVLPVSVAVARSSRTTGKSENSESSRSQSVCPLQQECWNPAVLAGAAESATELGAPPVQTQDHGKRSDLP